MVKIINNYYLDADKYNIILLKEKTIKEGKHAGEKMHITCGYFGSLTSVLQYIQKRQIFKTIHKEDLTLQELIEKVDEITSKLLTVSKEKQL